MPSLTVELLEDLFRAAEESDVDAVVPESAGGLDPLCAVYHRSCLAKAAAAIDRKIFKMQDFVSTLRFRRWPVPDPAPLENVNTPDEWNSRGNGTGNQAGTGSMTPAPEQGNGEPIVNPQHYIEFRHVYKTFDHPVLVDVNFQWMRARRWRSSGAAASASR